jgi:carbamoyl-phosphate synthase large subunit
MITISESKYSVLVTGIGGGGHGEQILKALRLADSYFIVGCDANEMCANRNNVDIFSVLPLANDTCYIKNLIDLAKKYDCKAIFHGSEQEMMVHSEHRRYLSELGFYVPVNSNSVIGTCQDKVATMNHLRSRGFVVPEYQQISKIEDVSEFSRFPAILKPIRGGGSANVFIVQDKNELIQFSRYLLSQFDSFVLQEYIGTPDREYTVGITFGQDGHLINSIAIKRIINNALTIRTKLPNRTSRKDLGSWLVISTGISQGHIGKWPELLRQCEQIASSLNPTAPINIQCREVNGNVIPFEINPRFSGTTSLRAMVGYNEPDILFRRDVLGEKITDYFEYSEGLILRTLQENLITI